MHEANFKILPQNLPETKMETYLQINTLVALSVTIHCAQNTYFIQIKHTTFLVNNKAGLF